MKVVHLDEDARRERDADVFVSSALHHNALTEDADGITLSLSEVTFRPSERTTFHTHPNGQILYVTEGTGYVATETDRREVGPGDVVYFPPGENHWHGATEDTAVTHLSFLAYQGESGLDELGDVPEY